MPICGGRTGECSYFRYVLEFPGNGGGYEGGQIFLGMHLIFVSQSLCVYVNVSALNGYVFALVTGASVAAGTPNESEGVCHLHCTCYGLCI